MMTFSFIIPVYNCRKTLQSCVESIEDVCSNYSEFNIEIILVDDGSTDGSSKICDQLSISKRGAVQIIAYHQNNQGVSSARNRGIDLATGEYVLFIDSDDTVDSNLLRMLLLKICETPSVDLAVYGIFFDYYLGNKCYRSDVLLPSISGMCHKNVWKQQIKSLYNANVLSALWNKVIRRNLLIENALKLDSSMIILEDLEFSLRCMNCAEDIFFFDKPVYHYNHFGHNDNAGKRLNRIPHIHTVIEKIESSLLLYRPSLSPGELNEILLMNYSNLMQEKIAVASIKQIQIICDDFKMWIDKKAMNSTISNSDYYKKIYYNKAVELFMRSRKTKIRHFIANIVKYIIGDFRKWKR